jgi:hypothetical protein
MGVYLYTVFRSGRITAKLTDTNPLHDQNLTLFRLSFAWKYWFSNETPSEKRALSMIHHNARKAISAADYSGYVYVGKEPRDGAWVYRLDDGVASYDDCFAVPGTLVGVLRRWTGPGRRVWWDIDTSCTDEAELIKRERQALTTAIGEALS